MRIALKDHGLIPVIILLIGLTTLSSCEKKNHTSVKGKIINIVTKQPVDSVEIWICDGLPIAGSNSRSNCAHKLNYYNGDFDIELNSGDVTLFFTKPGYQYTNYPGGAIGITSVPYGDNENMTFEIEPKCGFYPVYASHHNTREDTLITNVGQNYRRQFNFHMAYDDTYRGIGPFNRRQFGDGLLRIGDMHVVYKLRYTRNGNWEELIDSVYVPQGHVYNDTIWY